MDNCVHCYHFKGKKMHSIYLDAPVQCMAPLISPKTKTKGMLVALQNGEVRLYSGKTLIHTIETRESVMGMCFGTFGREEGTLCIVPRQLSQPFAASMLLRL